MQQVNKLLANMSTTELISALKKVKELQDQELINMFSYELALRFYKYEDINREVPFMDLLTLFGYVNPTKDVKKSKKKKFFNK